MSVDIYICAMSNSPLTLRNVYSSLYVKPSLYIQSKQDMLFEYQGTMITYVGDRIAFEEKI